MSRVMVIKKIWPKLVLSGVHGGHHYTSQKVQVHMSHLQRAGIIIGLSMYITFNGG